MTHLNRTNLGLTVLPSVSVITNLVDEVLDDEPTDCPEVLAPDGVWKITVV